ncbi:MAG TPA: aldo/keto reductase [Spongiibacteraceae bacterium]|nr:aldo/keto reductase [Spongiibacteraceae bacterium]
MATQPTIALNDTRVIPQLGFGVWQVPGDITAPVVSEAIAAGYRSIDTAAVYENEAGVGAALQNSSVPREQLFITTKLWNSRHGYDDALRSFDKSLSRLGLDYLDLFLIHWPAPRQNLYVEAWRALVELQRQGRVKSIGVSNFNIPHLQRIIDTSGVVPALNQVELHPRFQQKTLREFHAQHGIATEAWSPLGQGQLLEDVTVRAIANKHARSPAQIILRWHLESGLIAIPKSVTPARIRENFAVFDFRLDADDMRRLDGLDAADGRIGPDPETADF